MGIVILILMMGILASSFFIENKKIKIILSLSLVLSILLILFYGLKEMKEQNLFLEGTVNTFISCEKAGDKCAVDFVNGLDYYVRKYK